MQMQLRDSIRNAFRDDDTKPYTPGKLYSLYVAVMENQAGGLVIDPARDVNSPDPACFDESKAYQIADPATVPRKVQWAATRFVAAMQREVDRHRAEPTYLQAMMRVPLYSEIILGSPTVVLRWYLEQYTTLFAERGLDANIEALFDCIKCRAKNQWFNDIMAEIWRFRHRRVVHFEGVDEDGHEVKRLRTLLYIFFGEYLHHELYSRRSSTPGDLYRFVCTLPAREAEEIIEPLYEHLIYDPDTRDSPIRNRRIARASALLLTAVPVLKRSWIRYFQRRPREIALDIQDSPLAEGRHVVYTREERIALYRERIQFSMDWEVAFMKGRNAWTRMPDFSKHPGRPAFP
jgi:hypothetical protein